MNLMNRLDAKAATTVRGYTESVRRGLLPFDGRPRDGRTWARRDRIAVLVEEIDAATRRLNNRTDAMQLFRLITELDEWVRRERAFLRDYPIPPPSEWTRRELSPTAWRQINRAWKRMLRSVEADSV